MSQTCVEDPNARGRSTATHTHKRARTWRKESRRTVHSRRHTQKHRHPHRTAKQQCEQHTHGRNKRNEAHPIPPQCFTYLCPEGIALRLTAGRGEWRPTLTVRHGAHHPLPSERTHQGAQSPSYHRNGEQEQSSSRTIDASSRKEKVMRECQLHS
ncbi:hypothetical protein TcCL_ESM11065 [Trypanosoma cruzi]|nr:hypothetical protein TcCL_ESM11065 [Trypanosoma cruzi]